MNSKSSANSESQKSPKSGAPIRKSSSRRSKSRKSDSGFAPKKRRLGLWVFLGVTALIVLTASLMEVERRRNEQSNQRPQSPRKQTQNDYETALASDDFQLIRSTHESLQTPRNEELPIRIENLGRQVELANRAREIAAESEESAWAELAYLKSMVLLETVSFANGMEQSRYFSELKNFASKMEASSVPKIAEESTIALLISDIIEFMRMENWQIAKADLVDKFLDVHRRYPSNKKIAKSIQKASLMFRPFPKFKDLECEILNVNAAHYLASDDIALKELGGQLATELVLFKYNLRYAENSFINDRVGAAAETSEILDKILASEKQLTAHTIARLVGACHVLELFRFYDLAIENVTKIQARANSIADDEHRTNVQQIIANMITRCRAIGNEIEFEDVACDGSKIRSSDLPQTPLVVCYLPGNSERLNEVLNFIKELKSRLMGEVEIVMVAINGTKSELVELAKFSHLENQLIIDPSASSAVFRQFPVRLRPSFLLVNSDKIMVEKVVDIRELSGRIDELLFTERR